MEAKEAPKKLYYAPYGDISEEYPITDNDIEYTRTDSFIKKAEDWVKNRAELFAMQTQLTTYYDYKRAVEDFKIYMKKENEL